MKGPNAQASPIFVKVHDQVKWTVKRAETFPKTQRFFTAKRLQDAIFDVYEGISTAARHPRPISMLQGVDGRLAAYRHYLRLSMELGFVSFKQYSHGAEGADEIGRLIGGWMKACR